jgi:hypothetical protein
MLRISILLATGFVGWLALSDWRDTPQPVSVVRAEPARSESSEALSVDEALVAGPLPPVVSVPELEILVRTSSGRGKGADPVPGIAFEVVHLGTFFVECPDSLTAQRSNETGACVATGSTDDTGVAHIALPADVGVDERGSPNVLVRVVEPGYQQRTARAWVPRGGGVPTARPAVVSGATARGRVVDGGGSPVLAQVRAERWIEDVDVGRRLHGQALAIPLPDGRFELHLREDLFDVLLLADAEGSGTGARLGVDLPLADPPQDLELVVAGAGALRGRVEGLDGRPLGGLSLLVRHAELDGHPLRAAEPAMSLLRTEGRGRIEVQLETDSDGRFELTGLRPESYVVRAKLQDGSTYGYGTLLTGRPVLAVDAEILLHFEQPQLVVRLMDAEGRPWSDGRIVAATDEHELGWFVSPSVAVYPLSPPGTEAQLRGDSLKALRSLAGELAYSVEAGARYLVAIRGQAFTAPAREVEVPLAGGSIEVVVHAAPTTAWGEVVALVDTQRTAGDYRISLEDVSTGLRVCDVDAPLGAVPLQRAPAGRYRLVVEGVASGDSWHGTVWTTRNLGRAEVEIDVIAGARVEVPITIGEGARIDLELAGEPDAGDREAVARSEPWMLEPQNVAGLPERVASASVVLLRPQRGFESVFRLIEITGGSGAGKHLAQNWPLGLRETSQVVSPGTWTLVARLPGGREVAAEVVLRAGETTPVRLEFPP